MQSVQDKIIEVLGQQTVPISLTRNRYDVVLESHWRASDGKWGRIGLNQTYAND